VGETDYSHSLIKSVVVSSLPTALVDKLCHFICKTVHLRLRTDDLLQRVDRLEQDNVVYRVENFVVIDVVGGEDILLFMKILHVFDFCGLWYICGHVYTCVKYVAHKHAYNVENSKCCAVLVPLQEYDQCALDGYVDENDDLFISLRYRLVDRT